MGIASLEDKIAQQAVLWVLQSIYEQDFPGFTHKCARQRNQGVDQLLSQTDPFGAVTWFDYDNLGRMTRRTDPDPDGAGPLSSATADYAYDLVGNLTGVTDAAGNNTVYSHDALERVRRG